MIKEKIVEIKWEGKTKGHYMSFGYKFTKLKDVFSVKIEHLPKTSSVKITSICDACGSEKNTKFYNHNDICFKCRHKRENGEKSKNKVINFDLILEKTVTVKWSRSSKEHYISLGYKFTKMFDEFVVDIRHLTKGSNIKVTLVCEICGGERFVQYCSYASKCNKCHMSELGKSQKRIDAVSNSEKVKENGRRQLKSRYGPLSWNWNNGLSKERRSLRRDKHTVEWSKEIKSKYNYTCQVCDARGVRLNSHHLMPYCKYPDLRYDINNGICLCVECHSEYHKFYGYKDANEESFYEYIRLKEFGEYIS